MEVGEQDWFGTGGAEWNVGKVIYQYGKGKRTSSTKWRKTFSLIFGDEWTSSYAWSKQRETNQKTGQNYCLTAVLNCLIWKVWLGLLTLWWSLTNDSALLIVVTTSMLCRHGELQPKYCVKVNTSCMWTPSLKLLWIGPSYFLLKIQTYEIT